MGFASMASRDPAMVQHISYLNEEMNRLRHENKVVHTEAKA